MDRWEKALTFRGRVAYFAPYVLLLLVAAMNLVPFAEIKSTTEEDGDVVYSSTVKLHPDHAVNVVYSETSEEELEQFGGDVTTKTSVEDGFIATTFFDGVPELAESLDERLNRVTFWVLLVVVIGFAAKDRGKGLQIGTASFSDRRAIQGAVMAFISVLLLLMVGSIFSDFGSLKEEIREDVEDDEDLASFNEGAWGAIVQETTEEGVDNAVKWSPSWMFYFALLTLFVSLAAAVAGLSTLMPGLDVDEVPVWPQGEVPAFLDKDFTTAWFGAVVIAILVALLAPWYSIDQTWTLSEETEPGQFDNSTHDLGWSLNPFYTVLVNDTGLFNGGSGETDREFSGYQDRYELESTAPVLLGLRWPLVFSLLMLAGWGAAHFWPKARDELNLGKERTGLVFVTGLAFILALSNIGEFEESMTSEVGTDLVEMSPMLNSTFRHFGVQDLFSGQSFSSDFDFNDDNFVFINAQMVWGPSFGFLAVSTLPWLFLGAFSSTMAPRFLERFSEEWDGTVDEPLFDRERWTVKPVVATLVGVLLISTLGAFPISSLNDVSDAAPAGMYQWSLDWTSTAEDTDESAILADGESRTFTINSVDAAIGNTTVFFYFINCDEGSSGAVTDNPDEIQYVVSPPSGADTDGMVLSGNIACGTLGTGVNDYAEAEVYLPNEEYAPDEATYLSYIEFLTPFDGEWSVEVTATVEGGVTPLDNDPDLFVQVGLSLRGYDGFTAEQIEN